MPARQRRKCDAQLRLDGHREIGRNPDAEANRRPKEEPFSLAFEDLDGTRPALRAQGAADVEVACVRRHADQPKRELS